MRQHYFIQIRQLSSIWLGRWSIELPSEFDVVFDNVGPALAFVGRPVLFLMLSFAIRHLTTLATDLRRCTTTEGAHSWHGLSSFLIVSLVESDDIQ